MKASNKDVKPLCGLAQYGTSCLTPHLSHLILGFRKTVALVLKKIQMTPHLFHSIVDGTMFLIADWTGKLTAAPEINVDVEFADLFIKRNILDVKRFFDSQRHFKKV